MNEQFEKKFTRVEKGRVSMGIVELFEEGFFTAFWNWSNPLLTVLVYACVLVGTIFQGIIQKKSKTNSEVAVAQYLRNWNDRQ